MSIDHNAICVPSFRGGAMPSSMLATEAMISNAKVSNVLSSNAMTLDLILSAALRDARVACEFNRDLYPPSSPPAMH